LNDSLSSLIAAYRAENPGSSLDQRALRERVLAAAWRRRQRRARRLTWLLPIAAVLVGSGALTATGARTEVAHFVAWLTGPPAAVSPAVERRATRDAHVSAQRPPQNQSPIPALAPTPELPSRPAPVLPLESLPLAPAPRLRSPSAPPPAHASAPAPASALAPAPAPAPPPASALAPAPASASAPPSDPVLLADLSAYRTAHRLHFAAANYAQAFAAWNAYLAQFPSGTFVPEARLNRAVCLVRLGHSAEARTALNAIAHRDGAYGRVQAQRLLEALGP
jgi:hypothetical protein